MNMLPAGTMSVEMAKRMCDDFDSPLDEADATKTIIASRLMETRIVLVKKRRWLHRKQPSYYAVYIGFEPTKSSERPTSVEGLTADMFGNWCNTLAHAYMYAAEHKINLSQQGISYVMDDLRKWQRVLKNI